MENLAFALIAAFVIFYGAVSKRLESTIISGPMVFVVFGFILSSEVTGLITFQEHTLINIIANITLILILFSDASRINLTLFRKEQDLPRRLLGLGLPLTILAGFLVALLLLTGLPLWQAAVLATVLAPTDAALAQAVIDSERVPGRIRQALNVESGLNDGICFPILLLFIYLADTSSGHYPVSFWLRFISFQLVLGPIIGIVVGYVGGKIVLWSVEKGYITGNFQRLSIVGLSFLAFFAAELIGGNGFMSAFFAGLVFGNTARKVSGPIYHFGEAEGELFILLTFILFGAIMVPDVLENFSWIYVIYGLLSLTLVRMIPVALSMTGMGLTTPSFIYLGWFGPRGAASILYVLLVVDKSHLSGENLIFNITATTVLLSVFVHGLTSVPGAKAYASAIDKRPPEEKDSEMKEVRHLPTRIKHSRFNKHLDSL